MKIVICTTPIRPEPTTYPPFGSMALIQSLRSAGYDPYFFDIDALRPTFEEVVQFFRTQAPDVVGISSVVSTAYAYTKELALAIKEVSPQTKILVGGNLAASAEILLRFCKIDACGVGEGERVIVNLTRYWESHKTTNDYSQLRQIKGIAYLDDSGEVVFTGYEPAILANDFLSPDWTVLEKYSKMANFITDPLSQREYTQDPRTYEPHRRGKMAATALTAKGCVARCTFCHRWDRGYRHWPVDRIIENIEYLAERYNVGFINFGDENFGSDRKKTEELIKKIKPLDVLYQVAGVRCRSVDPDVLARLKDSGCVGLFYGMESGSPNILKVMEKNTELQQNLNAALWTHQAGLYTIYQLVLAMPGENPQTVAETGEFIKKVTEFLPEPPHVRLSVNYIQALPGTPVYEYARDTGLVGKTLEEEEKYLIKISDIDAVDDSKFLNFTEYDYLTVQSWRQKIVFDAQMNWYKKRSWKPAPKAPAAAMLNGEVRAPEGYKEYHRGGYFNLGHVVISHPLFYRFMSSPVALPLRYMYPMAYVLIKDLKNLPKRQFLGYLREHLSRKVAKPPRFRDFRSLRKVMEDRTASPSTTSEQSMLPLREGR